MKMKWSSIMLTTLVAFFFSAALYAQDTETNATNETDTEGSGLPGDHFSLEGALEMFKKSENLEDFEKALNTEDNIVNNLDLNEDGETDYIKVIDHMDGDVHAIVLQAVVSEKESQDVAVIEIEKTGAESAELQIIGDEDIYGEQVISEPSDEDKDGGKKGGKGGPYLMQPPMPFVVNVWLWSPVRFVYRPGYVVYASPWGWRRYPGWWRPFRPQPFAVWRVRVAPFRPHYRIVTTHRVVRAHRVYTPVRTHSTVVHTRTTKVYQGPHGKTTKVTKSTTTVRGKNGHVKGQKSTVKVQRGRRH